MKKLRSLLAFTLVLLVLSTCSTLIVADHLDTVPLRAISEAAGARVFWDASRNEAAIYKGADEILVNLANRVSPSFTINGATYAYGGSLSIDYAQGVIHIDTAFADKLLAIFSEDGPYVYRLDESGEVIKTDKARRQDSSRAALTDAPWSSAEEAYAGKIDEAYAFDLAKKLSAIGDSSLGGKTAGSGGEHKAAKLLYEEMQAIGLQNVHMDPFPVDRWQFNDATLTVAGVEKEIKPYSYASGKTPPDGVAAEIIYAGKGTASDYEDVDPRGKIVLVDLDQRGEWWVTYPTIEAANRGAIAIINNCTDGYGQLNEETYNTQDFCGPVTIPSLNITISDANLIKEALAEADDQLTAQLYVDNEAGGNGISYNIWGEIPGKTDEAILVGDHYDAHFEGFQDDACAVGLTLAVAKGMLASGYEPERTIRFILHGAEEYGRTNTRYDWSIGAWEQINSIHP
ncbi:MAG: M28 family peptidase, partial [Peptococcaceae bacterium]|nr:M28 family peptidase [Peptococcaceae bacterium]